MNQEKFRLSKTRVKVYLKPEYHPALRGTNLSHVDIGRKARELFGRRHGNVAGLPKICSVKSEDAQTWRHFSHLFFMTPEKKGRWLKAFLEKSLKRELNRDFDKTLRAAKLMFWRGKRARPMYRPTPKLNCREGKTEVDLTILTGKAIVFVEAKYQSEIEMRTTYCPNRNQIIRNIDVGTYYAWNRGLEFYFILLTSVDRDNSIKLLKQYLDNPQEIIDSLPHRADVPKRIEEITNNLGLIAWNELPRSLKQSFREQNGEKKNNCR